MQKILSPKRKV